MRYCTNCQAQLDPTWKFCAVCSAPVPGSEIPPPPPPGYWGEPVETKRPVRVFWGFAALWTIACAALTVISLFSQYSVDTPALAKSTFQTWYNVPLITVFCLSGVLLLTRRTGAVGAGLLVGGLAVGVSQYLGVVGIFVKGTQKYGAILSVLALVMGLCAVGILVLLGVRQGASLSARRGAWLWALAAASVAAVFSVSAAANAIGFTAQIPDTSPDTWPATGTKTLHTVCCTPLTVHGWDRAQGVSLLILAVLVPLIAALWLPAKAGVAAIIGAALVMLSGPLADLTALNTPIAPEVQHPGTSASYAVTVTQHALPALWIACIAPAVLILIAIGRGLHASSRS